MSNRVGGKLSAGRNPYEEARKAVFRTTTIKAGATSRSEPFLSAYLSQINLEAAKGNPSAIKEQHWFMKRLDDRGQLVEPDCKTELSAIEKREQEHDRNTRTCVMLVVSVSELVRSRVVAEIEEEHGRVHGANDVLPDLFTDSVYDSYRPAIHDFQKSLRPKDPAVGYRRPPVHSQIPKGKSGNPSGRPKRQDDAWSAFRHSLLRFIPLTVDGVPVPKTTAYVACLQLCQQAIKGEPAARRLLRDLIVMLDDKGLLSPPRKRRRRRRALWTTAKHEELLELAREAIRAMIPDVWDSLKRAILKRNGFSADALAAT